MDNRVALVTGGTRGIGRVIAQEMRRHGVKVIVLSSKLPMGIVWDDHIKCDLADILSVAGVVDAVVQKFGRLDILVNNAGIQSQDWIDSMAVMLTAPYMLSYDASRVMQDGGHIVNILSTASFQGARNITPYVVAKHGLLGLTRAMAIELAPKIHVNAVAPGLTETDMIADMTPERKEFLKSITPMGRFCTPEEIADAVLFLVNSTAIYGQTITVDGGWLSKNG